jgi:hypothetical protein
MAPSVFNIKNKILIANQLQNSFFFTRHACEFASSISNKKLFSNLYIITNFLYHPNFETIIKKSKLHTMRLKGIFSTRRKKAQNAENFKRSIYNEESTSGELESSNSLSSEEEKSATKALQLRKYSRSVDGSAMAVFARMSTTIAGTLTEEEFGIQKNSLYRPHSNSYTSKVVHPVLCKRDIFIDRGTPVKSKFQNGKSMSSHRASNKQSCSNNNNKNNQYQKNKVIKNQCHPDKKYQQKITTPQQPRESNIYSKPDVPPSGKNSGRNLGKAATNKPVPSRNCVDHLPSYSISGSMLFRQKKQLSVETGRIVAEDGQMLSKNRNRLHFVQPEDHNQHMKNRKYSTPRRYPGTPVSPSSTVSSLTIPAELDFDGTPMARFHQQMKSPPELEGIEERSCEDRVLTEV